MTSRLPITKLTPIDPEKINNVEILQGIYGLDRIEKYKVSLQAMDIPGLLTRLKTTDNPALVWEIHLELDRRNIPPCARWPAKDETPMLEYITWLADVLWFARRNPNYEPAHQKWRGIFRYACNGEQWHKTAVWLHVMNTGRSKKPTFYVKGLGLSDKQRQPLLSLQAAKARPYRRLLNRMDEFAEMLLKDAIGHPDKSGMKTPTKIAEERKQILRCTLMAGGDRTFATELLALIYGRKVSRPYVTTCVGKIMKATGLKL